MKLGKWEGEGWTSGGVEERGEGGGYGRRRKKREGRTSGGVEEREGGGYVRRRKKREGRTSGGVEVRGEGEGKWGKEKV